MLLSITAPPMQNTVEFHSVVPTPRFALKVSPPAMDEKIEGGTPKVGRSSLEGRQFFGLPLVCCYLAVQLIFLCVLLDPDEDGSLVSCHFGPGESQNHGPGVGFDVGAGPREGSTTAGNRGLSLLHAKHTALALQAHSSFDAANRRAIDTLAHGECRPGRSLFGSFCAHGFPLMLMIIALTCSLSSLAVAKNRRLHRRRRRRCFYAGTAEMTGWLADAQNEREKCTCVVSQGLAERQQNARTSKKSTYRAVPLCHAYVTGRRLAFHTCAC